MSAARLHPQNPQGPWVQRYAGSPPMPSCPEQNTVRTPLTCGGPERQSLRDVPNRLDPSVCNHGDAEPPGVFGDLVDCCGLGAAARQHCGQGEGSGRSAPPQQHVLSPADPSTHMLQYPGTHKSLGCSFPRAELQEKGMPRRCCWDILTALDSKKLWVTLGQGFFDPTPGIS